MRVNYVEAPVPAIGTYGYIKNLVTLAGAGLVVRGGAIMHRYGLGSWQRGREVIWAKAFAALQLPVYLTIHGRGICEPGAGRWLDSKTFVFNESVVANEEGLRQLQFVLERARDRVRARAQPGLVRLDRRRQHRHVPHGHGPDGSRPSASRCSRRTSSTTASCAELLRRDFRIVEVPVEEYWDLAVNGVTLEPGKVVINQARRRSSPGSSAPASR